ncbi:Nitrogen fixation protein of unknown function [Planctomycetes bacterium Pan216]|uniref:Nif11 domain-containing protein n=1 Tax=Kolteria novifilia TaxID=2527975 RepID=A0A518B6M6_9BACT|nr:Nitrogen fixation protein of unknown function [Planctomycetes bacterium Pan216]
MSVEAIVAFLDAVQEDDALRSLLSSQVTTTQADRIAQIAHIAKESGFDFCGAEYERYVRSLIQPSFDVGLSGYSEFGSDRDSEFDTDRDIFDDFTPAPVFDA